MPAMKIIIINPPIRLGDKPRHLPHGLAILANIMRKKLGITPVFLDANAHRWSNEELEEKLKNIQFDVVLIGGLIPVYKRIVRYAEMIRKISPRAVIIAGGSAAMSVPELLLRRSEVDIVCAGEGEKVIVELLQALDNDLNCDLSAVKGFYVKRGEEITYTGDAGLIDSLDEESDVPAYDLLPMDIYLSNPVVGLGRDVDFVSSRGCPFGCTFCYQPWGRGFRAHSAEFVLDAVWRLKSEYSIDFVSFQDDEFMAGCKRVVEFCNKVQARAPGLLWSCTGRANLVDEDIVGMMRRAGCVSISYGFESGSSRMLKSMNKAVSLEQMEKAVRIARKYGMMIPVSFIVGMPGENKESCAETVDFCVKNQLPLKSLMFATPYPGTIIFADALSSGRIKADSLHEYVCKLEDARDFVINLTDAFSDDELVAKREEMIAEVGRRVKCRSEEEYMVKLKSLFGGLVDGYLRDESLKTHRAEHGGIDLF